MRKVNIAAELARIQPRSGLAPIARINEVEVKLGRFQGRFPWHRHEREDELFWVVKGSLRIEFHDREVTLGEGECLVVPKGVEHRSVADSEAHVVVMHPDTVELPPPAERA